YNPNGYTASATYSKTTSIKEDKRLEENNKYLNKNSDKENQETNIATPTPNKDNNDNDGTNEGTVKENKIQFDYSFSEDNVNKKCSNKWTKRGELDVRMFDYCKRKQKESYTELLHLISEINNDEVFSKFFNDKFKLIWNYWTKQGITDYSMVKYTLYKEYDAYKDFLYEVKLPNVDRDKLN